MGGGFIVIGIVLFFVVLALISGVNAISIAWKECIKARNTKNFWIILSKNMVGLRYALAIVSIFSIFVWLALEIRISYLNKSKQTKQ